MTEAEQLAPVQVVHKGDNIAVGFAADRVVTGASLDTPLPAWANRQLMRIRGEPQDSDE